MKFDVVVASPPYNSMTGTWDKHVRKHVRLLDNGGHYGILSAIGTKHELVLDICEAYEVVMAVQYNKYIEGMPYPKRTSNIYCFIWKKN